MKKWILFLVATMLLASCSGPATNNTQSPEVSTETEQNLSQKHLVASFYPLAYIASEIVGDKMVVSNLAGARDVHHFTPSPQDMSKLNEAALVVYQGAELEGWTDDVIPELEKKGVTTLAVSDNLELHKMEEHEDHEDEHHDEDGHEEEDHHDDDEHEEDHDDHSEEEHEDHEEEDHHDEHHHGEYDPHTWLDPVLAQDMVRALLQSIVEVDPENSETYEANAQDLITRFQQLDEDYSEALSSCQGDEVIVSHDAYGYLAERYGFEMHAIAGLSTHDEPSAKLLAELKEEAEEGITHILVEENSVRRFADTLAEETGLESAPINPLGRGTLDPDKDFFTIMEENLESLATALQCQTS